MICEHYKYPVVLETYVTEHQKKISILKYMQTQQC